MEKTAQNVRRQCCQCSNALFILCQQRLVTLSESSNLLRSHFCHWCLAVNLRIGIYNGEMAFNRLFDDGWSDLDDFFRIARIADFG